MQLTQDYLKSILDYVPETGTFTWKIKHFYKCHVGSTAGGINGCGYIQIKINNKCYKAHRLAFFYVYGIWPENDIDHINGVRNDNRLENLREATRIQNCQNRKRCQVNNASSGLLGVSYSKNKNKYASQIMLNKKQNHLGYFSTPEEAHDAYLKAKRQIHEFGTL